MDCDEIKDKLLKYLNKKGIEIILNNDRLIWNYENNYSKFKIELNFETIKYKEEEYYSITYYCSSNTGWYLDVKRRKTSTLGNYCLNVYKTLIYIKIESDKKSELVKTETDNKNKYCLEIEAHYKKIHNRVNVTTYEYSDYVSINVHCYDNYKPTDYNILYDKTKNKYFLENKTENLSKEYFLD